MASKTCRCGYIEPRKTTKFDTSPDYYERRDIEKIAPCCYKGFPNRKIWKPFEVKIPRLIGVTRRTFANYFSKGDPLDRYFQRLKVYKEKELKNCLELDNIVEMTCCNNCESRQIKPKASRNGRKAKLPEFVPSKEGLVQRGLLDANDSVRYHDPCRFIYPCYINCCHLDNYSCC